jgi:hypothetical protein
MDVQTAGVEVAARTPPHFPGFDAVGIYLVSFDRVARAPCLPARLR